jgi:hypothetical protein
VTGGVETSLQARINTAEYTVMIGVLISSSVLLYSSILMTDNVCVFVANTKNEMNDTAGGINSILIWQQFFVYTKNETNRSNNSKRSGRAVCGSAN